MSNIDQYKALTNDPTKDISMDKLAELITRTEASGRISRSEVEPFIDILPPTVSLEDFDEEPSSRGQAMALEGFASFLKVGLAVAVIGAIGFVIWHLISSRKKGEKLNEDAIIYQNLYNALTTQERFVQASPFNGAGMVGNDSGFEGLNLANALSSIMGTNGAMRTDLETQGSRHIAFCLYGEDPSILTAISQHLDAEKASQKAAIEKLGKVLKEATSKITSGRQKDVEKELIDIRTMVERMSIGGQLQAAWGNRIPKVTAAPGEHGSSYALQVVQAIEEYFVSRESASRNYAEDILKDIVSFTSLARIGNCKLDPSTSRPALEAIVKACKDANSACEKMKKDAESAHLTAEVQAEFEETIRVIQNNTKVTEKLLDMASVEATSLQKYLQFLSRVAKQTSEFGEAIAKANNESTLAKELGRHADSVKKAVKAIK